MPQHPIPRFAREKVDVVVVLQTNLLLISSEPIAAIAPEKRLPAVFGYREHVAMGRLVSSGVDLPAIRQEWNTWPHIIVEPADGAQRVAM